MIKISNLSGMIPIFALSLCTSLAQADIIDGGVVTISFETDADGNGLANGLAITEAPAGNTDIEIRDSDGPTTRVPEGNGNQLIPVSNFFTITSTGNDHVGAAIFDTTPRFTDGLGVSGPNSFPIPADADIADPDLLVNTGNVLILQEDNQIAGRDTRRDGDGNLIFRQPDDDVHPGSIVFDFNEAVTAISIDLVDFNGGASGEVTLSDIAGNQRVLTVPEEFTYDLAEVLEDTEGDRLGDGDPSNDPVEGFATLVFGELGPQFGEGRLDENGDEIQTTVVDTGDFDINQVVTIEVAFGGPNPSGAIDNLVFAVPEPSSAILLAGFGLFGISLRRRK